MTTDQIVTTARNHYNETGTDQHRNTITLEYVQAYPLGNVKDLSHHFYLWYYLKHMTAFTWMSIQDIPTWEESPFNDLEISPITLDGRGAPDVCDKEEEADYWSVFACMNLGGRVALADCNTKDIAIELADGIARHLDPAFQPSTRWQDTFNFTYIQLTEAMALAIGKLKTENTIP